MKGKFEKDIEKQLSDFRLEPPAQVWKEVEAVLHPRRKRRVIAWWWFGIPVLAVIGIATWFYTSKPLNHHPVTHNTANNTVITHNLHPVLPATAAISTAIPKSVTINNKTNNVNKTVNPTYNTVINQKHYRMPAMATNSNTAISSQHKEQETSKAVNTNEETITLTQDNDHDHITTSAATVADTGSHAVAVVVNDTAIAVKKQDSVTAKKKTATGTGIAARKTPKASNPKHQWSVVAGGGLSLIQPGTLFTANTNNAYGSSTPTNSYPPRNNTPLATAQTGFHLMGGIQYEYSLGKHWEAYTGLQYRYIQNNQQVGYDSITTNYGLANYFTRGRSDTKRNYSHQLELPVYVGYIINPSKKSQVQLLAGASVAYAVSEKWLIVSNIDKRYYYQPSLDNHVLISTRVGVSYSYHTLFQAALLMDQSLTPVQQATDKYYRQQFSLQVSVPLSTFKRKHTK